MAKIVGEVSIGGSKPIPIDIKHLPMETTIEELAKICCKRGISVKITLKEKELDSERAQ